MARFPKKEPEIVAMAEQLWQGLWDNNSTYPAPPRHPFFLRFKMLTYKNHRGTAIAKQAAAEAATATQNDALDDMAEAMKSDIRYAENTVNYDDDKLKLIGWAGRKAATPLAVPGQPRLFEAPKQGDGWVFLDWKAPVDGGKVAAYKIMRRERDGGSWEDVATAVISEATLVEQPRGKELEYRVIGLNKAGQSQPGNTVNVVL